MSNELNAGLVSNVVAGQCPTTKIFLKILKLCPNYDYHF
jgi:hypothetical protein